MSRARAAPSKKIKAATGQRAPKFQFCLSPSKSRCLLGRGIGVACAVGIVDLKSTPSNPHAESSYSLRLKSIYCRNSYM